MPPELVRLGLWVAHEYCSTPARGLDLVLPPGTTRARGETRARTEIVARSTAAAGAALESARLGSVQRRALELLAVAGEPGLSAPELAAHGRRARRPAAAGGPRARGPLRAPGQSPSAHRGGRGPGDPVELDPAQRAAVARLVGALDASQGAELLLHGVTGSGKTEVYLAAAEAALERGRGSIVLVPEIGMTPQAVGRFVARFGDRVAVLHSRLRAGERRDEWHRLRDGEARICVGPRSAIFAPIDDLGLIVVDEEHDASYKQEGDPRYDAREVARRRATECGATLVLGLGDPAAGELARARADRAAQPGRRAGAAHGRGDRHARPRRARRPARRGDAGCARRGRRTGRQGDRAHQPARLGAAPLLPRLRLGRRMPELRRLAGRPRRRPGPALSPLRARAAPAAGDARTAAR